MGEGPLLAGSMDTKIWALLQSIPSKAEMDSLLNAKFEAHKIGVEAMLKSEILGLKKELGAMAKKMEVMESQLNATQAKLSDIEATTAGVNNYVLDLAFKTLDLENRSRRTNIRLRGLPESITNEELENTAKCIFNQYLDLPPESELKIDRIHRVPAGRPKSADRPRDVLCSMHHYTQKESIMRAAWTKGSLDHKGTPIHLLQDVSKKILDLRRALRPLLEAARQHGVDYKWGYPFFLILRKAGRSFILRTPAQVREACVFIGTPAVDVPDWFSILLEPTYRP